MINHIIEYKKNPSGAQAWLSVALYTELLDDKDIALMRSDYLPSISRKVVGGIYPYITV
jgi:hypothetical protein